MGTIFWIFGYFCDIVAELFQSLQCIVILLECYRNTVENIVTYFIVTLLQFCYFLGFLEFPPLWRYYCHNNAIILQYYRNNIAILSQYYRNNIAILSQYCCNMPRLAEDKALLPLSSHCSPIRI